MAAPATSVIPCDQRGMCDNHTISTRSCFNQLAQVLDTLQQYAGHWEAIEEINRPQGGGSA